VTLALADREPTANVLQTMGFERSEAEDGRVRYRTDTGDSAIGSVVDLVETDLGRGRMGLGTIHHVAFRANDQSQQEMWQQVLREHDLHVTNVIDREYFHSIYFREPGGVLFEIATMGPGFTIDESPEELGTQLMLPEWLEDEREEIEQRLAPFDQPAPMVNDLEN
jgi:glyoxalase family protein